MDCAQVVKACLARRAHQPLAHIRDDTELDTLQLDSLALVELLVELEHKHGIRVAVGDLGKLRTVRDLYPQVLEDGGDGG